MSESNTDGATQLEYGTDYELRCRTCGEECNACDCGNPYYDTVLKTVEVPDVPKGVIHERSGDTENAK